MVTVYVIESFTDQTWYTGMAMDAEKRLREHNTGKNRFTKGHMHWKMPPQTISIPNFLFTMCPYDPMCLCGKSLMNVK